jgi:hypothetical protein
VCVPKTCAQLGATCGSQGDGCGNILQCGTCTALQTCGGAGVLDTCGAPAVCTPASCASLAKNCGAVGDGCGNILQCGTCTAPQTCGGGGTSSVCGGSIACVPETCASLGYNCGSAGNGCGGTISCGATCPTGQACGGGGQPNVCGPVPATCPGGGSTTLTGYVYDPANNLPVYNALVYVPTGAVVTPTTGIVPTVCGCTAPPAYASAYTDISGKFVLNNPPTGTNVTVVVQLGKWQRVFSESITSCVATTLPAHLTLPSSRAQGNIPRFAIDTGAVDSMECVLRKMGIVDTEFVNPVITGGVPTAAGRIHMYEGSIYDGGARINSSTPLESALTESSTVMDSYDVILFPCQGNNGDYSAANGWPNTRANLISYANNGGRFFATHFHYDLLQGNGAFDGTAAWAPNTGTWGNLYGDTPYPSSINTGFARGATLASWLNQAVVYGGTYGQIPVGVVRNDFTSVVAPAQLWMSTLNDVNVGGTGQGPGAGIPIHYTFDTPFNGATSCGRVVYSDFHVESQVTNTSYHNVTFPNECSGAGTTMTPQEELLEFMLFDLTSCVSPPVCTPKTCAQEGFNCGPQSDGCGNIIQCGTCTTPQVCGGGGAPGVCGGTPCVAKTCAQQGFNCGSEGDGCGNTIQCGTCAAPQTCGGGGTPGVCGGTGCVPKTCAQEGFNCGAQGDGCGNEIQCGNCTPPQICGGAGVPGVCGGAACTPKTCAQLAVTCGPVGDGCGNLLQCGNCTPPQTCGGGGTAGQCGGTGCTAVTCSSLHLTCGPAGDGCGNTIQCGNCTPPQTCGGGGTPGQCGGTGCVAETCASQGFNCGPAGDGCGGSLSCGTCPAGQACGAGGKPGVCAPVDAGGTCVPETCSALHLGCGPAGDGCGGSLSCGTCTPPQTCGGGGTPGQCGSNGCVPATCASLNINCGPAGDGCGGEIQCGTCTLPDTCGGGGSPGHCGATVPPP